MNRSERDRLSKHSGLLMDSIAYLRYTMDRSQRMRWGIAHAMLWNSEALDHAAIWRRACAESVTMQGNKIKRGQG